MSAQGQLSSGFSDQEKILCTINDQLIFNDERDIVSTILEAIVHARLLLDAR